MSKSDFFQIPKPIKKIFYPEKKTLSWRLDSKKKIDEFNANEDFIAAQIIAFLEKNKPIKREKEEESGSPEEVTDLEYYSDQTINNSAGSRLSAVLHTSVSRMSIYKVGYPLNSSDAALSEINSESSSNNVGLLGANDHLG